MVGSSGTAVVSLPEDTQILITREFAAPRHLVWEAWTNPDLIRRWWHANRGEVASIDVDLRVGGQWRYVMRTGDGHEVGFHGEYREVAAPERLVYTEVYEGYPEAGALTTVTFIEEDGRTSATMLVEHETQEHRDMHVESGMEDGLQDALDLLEQLAIARA
jgi:uncharacterized protein YndB with AHSA1/START domain